MLLSAFNGPESMRTAPLKIGLGSSGLMSVQLSEVLVFVPSEPSDDHVINYMKKMFVHVKQGKELSRRFGLLLEIMYGQV